MESLVLLKIGFWQIVVILVVVIVIMVFARIMRDKR